MSSNRIYVTQSYSVVENDVYIEIHWYISHWYILSGTSRQFVFCKKNKDFTRETLGSSKRLKSKKKKKTSNSQFNQGLLDIKMIYLQIQHVGVRIHSFNLNSILIDGKKWKNFK